MRRAAKRDASEPAIVEALEAAGWEVHRSLPVDLLCLKLVSYEQMIAILQRSRGVFFIAMPLEAKTPATKAGKARKRRDQEHQEEFCKRWDVAKPTTPMEALLAVGERVTVW